jgi:hypothetical protein
VLAAEPGLLVTDTASREETRCRQFHGWLSLDIGGGSKILHEVTATVGLPQTTATGMRVPVRWEPAGAQRLLPSFAGELEFVCGRPGTVLTLRGSYSVPFGAIGRVGDGLAGRRLGRRVLQSYLDATATRLDKAVARYVAMPTHRPAPTGVDEPGEIGPENCIG